VLRPGRSLTVCSADVVALIDGKHKPVAAMLATMIAVNERPDLPHGM
jgi:hypothetical protein